MPLLGFGVYQNFDAKPSVLEAFKAGYRHVDSAQVYRNEPAVGEAIKESGLDRKELFITTKCLSKPPKKTTIEDGGAKDIKEGVRTSLVNLFGLDKNGELDKEAYIDLFLIHDPLSGRERRLAIYKALQDAKEAGQIRSVGVSNFGVKHLEELKEGGFAEKMPAVNQIELHPLCQQKPIVDYCKANSIVVQAYCPIIRGQMDIPAVQKIAKDHKRDPAQILLRWSLQKGYVPLPKSATPSRIHSNAQLYDFELNEKEMSELDALDSERGAISWNPVNAD
ncbi:NADP-dependent oxidoreductase domain-containing protein [Mycena maculata]|uniref:NADP-dependent oxidoreductase domain-containing protein n=1 Tax=Mycena maculata TaxID=230809 RepID=A0AAD7NYL8_9AGAR|nr:NADP-dependent oxidoreductase domain-containing protein [Mycena maculata]